jgi:hypothetical protein
MKLEHWELASKFPPLENVGPHSTDIGTGYADLQNFLPKRLLEVGKGQDNSWSVRLRSTRDMDPRMPYVTLSNCWGTYMPFKLTKSNLKRCKKRVPFARLSQNFQDAIEMAVSLGFEFIWIDSLCKSRQP